MVGKPRRRHSSTADIVRFGRTPGDCGVGGTGNVPVWPIGDHIIRILLGRHVVTSVSGAMYRGDLDDLETKLLFNPTRRRTDDDRTIGPTQSISAYSPTGLPVLPALTSSFSTTNF